MGSVVCLYTPVSQSVPEMEGIYATGGIFCLLLSRMYFWWSLCSLYLLACQVELPKGDSGLCCCVPCLSSAIISLFFFFFLDCKEHEPYQLCRRVHVENKKFSTTAAGPVTPLTKRMLRELEGAIIGSNCTHCTEHGHLAVSLQID